MFALLVFALGATTALAETTPALRGGGAPARSGAAPFLGARQEAASSSARVERQPRPAAT